VARVPPEPGRISCPDASDRRRDASHPRAIPSPATSRPCWHRRPGWPGPRGARPGPLDQVARDRALGARVRLARLGRARRLARSASGHEIVASWPQLRGRDRHRRARPAGRRLGSHVLRSGPRRRPGGLHRPGMLRRLVVRRSGDRRRDRHGPGRRPRPGPGTWVDDEDELEEHAALWDYPPEVVTHLEAVASTLRDEVEEHSAPFDDATPTRWLTLLGRTATA